MINNYSYDINKAQPNKDLSFANSAKKYNYTEIYGNSGLSEVNKNKKSINPSRANVQNIFNITMGQNHHFKLTIDGLMVDNSFSQSITTYVYKNKKKTKETRGYGKFLPIKNIAYKPISIESTRLQFGIFADFPIIHRRKVGSIQITLLDNVFNEYERAIYNWFGTCVPTSTGFVAPLMSIIRKAQYIEYDNKGKVSKTYTFEVIPDGEVSINRDYESNSLKEITFSVLIVSDIIGEVNEANLYKGSGVITENDLPEKEIWVIEETGIKNACYAFTDYDEYMAAVREGLKKYDGQCQIEGFQSYQLGVRQSEYDNLHQFGSNEMNKP